MNKPLIFLMFILVSTSAMAEWTKVNRAESFNLYVDFDSIYKDGNRVKIWFLNDFFIRKEGGELSTKFLVEIDCKDKTSRPISGPIFSSNMGSGYVIRSSNSSAQEWGSVVPGTVIETLWEAACGKNEK
ncbi:MAG: hypothetical protein Q8K59_07330 [Nitrosomonas sp.]|nr:hypothetical protein [Nitrosomonas sp.]MDP1950889.1 hypothetical protein [Nitrosomonas sp.]